METKPIKNIEDFEVYQKAVRLFNDFLEEDLLILQKSFAGRVLANNQLRYKRLKNVLPEELIAKRLSVLNEIRAMLESLIKKWI